MADGAPAGGLELSVVLVNHNGAGCLPRTLEALAGNTATEEAECIVVDSGSADDSWREVARYWARARALRFEENIGFCAGCNRGVEAAGGRLVAFVNFDGEVEPGWDLPLAGLLDDPSVSVSTGLLLSSDGETIQAAGLDIAPNTAVVGRQDGMPRSAAPASPVDVPAATGALMMVRRADFLALGGFYEPFVMYGEGAGGRVGPAGAGGRPGSSRRSGRRSPSSGGWGGSERAAVGPARHPVRATLLARCRPARGGGDQVPRTSRPRGHGPDLAIVG